MMIRIACAALALSASVSFAAPPSGDDARMEILRNKDVTGKVLKKLGLPARSYCWNACVQETECTALRWGVVQGDAAGLCVLLKGELHFRDPGRPTTDDGKRIVVVAAKKVLTGNAPRS